MVVAPEPAAALVSDQIYESLASIQAVELHPAPPAPTVVFQSVGPSSGPASPPDPVPETGLAPAQPETLYMEPQDQEPPEQVLIEDSGPDDDEEERLAEERRNDEGTDEDGPPEDPLWLSVNVSSFCLQVWTNVF